MSKTVLMLVEEIKYPIHVRCKLDDDLVETIAIQKQNGVKFPPIKVTQNKDLIDGWHRLQACKILDIKEIEAEIVHVSSEIEHIIFASRANLGGAKPPTIDDYKHVVELLLVRKATKEEICDATGLGYTLTLKLINDVKSVLRKRNISGALQDISDNNYTIAIASKKWGIPIEAIQENMRGHKRKTKQTVGGICSTISTVSRSYSGKFCKIAERLQREAHDGALSNKDIEAIFQVINNSQRKFIANAKEWEEKIRQHLR